MKSSTPNQAVYGPFAFAALLGLMLLSGCPGDESADMASQISGGRNTPAAGGGGGKKNDAKKDEEKAPDAAAAEGETPAEGEAPAEGEEAAVVDGTKVDVEVQSLDIKAPYPEYDDEGYYDIFMEVLTPKNPETDQTYGTAVWRFIGFDKDGKEVLSFVKQIKMPDSKPGPLRFNGMYCMAAPVAFEFYITDKTAQVGGTPTETEGAGGRGGGAGVGGGRGGAGGAGGGGEEGGGGGGSEGGGGGEEEPPVDDSGE